MRIKNQQWLWLGLSGLAISGLYAIIIVILRTPIISNLISDKLIFKSTLIIHVDLSVLVWLLSCLAFLLTRNRFVGSYEKVLPFTAILGMVMMAISPIFFESTPVMNNYVPILDNLLFSIGLSMFGSSIILQSIISFYFSMIGNRYNSIYRVFTLTSALIVAVSFLSVYLSAGGLNELVKIVPIDLDFYYEFLFWSGGHIMQFAYTQLFMMVILMLHELRIAQKAEYNNLYEMLFILNAFLGTSAISGHLFYDFADGAFKEFYTNHMIFTAGIAPSIFIFTIIFEGCMNKKSEVIPSFIHYSFLSSIALFLYGNLIGTHISGVNVSIPAHYHGAIVGISLALMGLALIVVWQNLLYTKGVIDKDSCVSCVLGDKKSISDLSYPKWPGRSILMVALGQILHITGLAFAGGYGVMRKDPNGNIASSAKVYMAMVGLGGGIAIIGGLIFVAICVKQLKKNCS